MLEIGAWCSRFSDCKVIVGGYFNVDLHTIRYDSVYLTCSKKLTGSQLSLPHAINKKLKCETKNEMMSVIGPVQSRYREVVQKVKEIYGGKDLLKR